MKRNKYLNTFETTADYNNYIESALPEFPNVGLTKDDDKLHYRRSSPNDYLIYGELTDPTQPPVFKLSNLTITAHVDLINNIFYIEQADITGINSFTGMSNFVRCSTSFNILKMSSSLFLNITSIAGNYPGQSPFSQQPITSLNLSGNTFSSVTSLKYAFHYCNFLKTLYLEECNFNNVTDLGGCFDGCSSLKDVYITVEATLMKLTNNLTSQGSKYIPASATIHYNDIDYKWQNNAWTAQS